MVESMFGKITVKECGDYEAQIKFESVFEEDPLYLATVDERGLNRLIFELTQVKNNFKKLRERRKEIMMKTDFATIYNDMERKYHPYPTEMACSDAFGHALEDGIIDKETYNAAREYYGKLWNYVGD